MTTVGQLITKGITTTIHVNDDGTYSFAIHTFDGPVYDGNRYTTYEKCVRAAEKASEEHLRSRFAPKTYQA